MAKRKFPFPRNTRHRGRVTVLVFRRPKERWYTGACLELDLVDQHENPDFLQRSLEEAAKGYVESVIEKDQPEDLLNRPAPAEFWEMYRRLLRIQSERRGHDVSFMRLAVMPYPAERSFARAPSHVPAWT